MINLPLIQLFFYIIKLSQNVESSVKNQQVFTNITDLVMGFHKTFVFIVFNLLPLNPCFSPSPLSPSKISPHFSRVSDSPISPTPSYPHWCNLKFLKKISWNLQFYPESMEGIDPPPPPGCVSQ